MGYWGAWGGAREGVWGCRALHEQAASLPLSPTPRCIHGCSILHTVFDRCEYWRLRDGAGKPPGLLGWWPSRAVTFLENHDTGSSQAHWPFPAHALEQGYAYILTHPGTPAIFWDHMFHNQQLRHVVQRLVALRKKQGIHCRRCVCVGG